MAKRLDKDTAKILSDQEKIENTVNSDGWKLIKKIFIQSLNGLDSMHSFPSTGMSFEAIGREVAARQAAIDLVLNIINQVEGLAEDSKSNRELFKDMKEESLVVTFE